MEIPQQMLRIPTMNFDRTIESILNKVSFRGVVMWVILFILTWIFLPESIRAWVSSHSLPVLPEDSLFLMLVFAISSSIYILADEGIKQVKKFSHLNLVTGKKAVRLIDALPSDERDVVQQFIDNGFMLIKIHEGQLISRLLSKGIITSTAFSAHTGRYTLSQNYLEIVKAYVAYKANKP